MKLFVVFIWHFSSIGNLVLLSNHCWLVSTQVVWPGFRAQTSMELWVRGQRSKSPPQSSVLGVGGLWMYVRCMSRHSHRGHSHVFWWGLSRCRRLLHACFVCLFVFFVCFLGGKVFCLSSWSWWNFVLLEICCHTCWQRIKNQGSFTTWPSKRLWFYYLLILKWADAELNCFIWILFFYCDIPVSTHFVIYCFHLMQST